MPHGYSNRAPVAIGVLIVLVLAGGMMIRLLRGGSSDSEACPRPFPTTDVTAEFLWTQTGDMLGPAPELAGTDPDSLRALTDPDDSETCRRLQELLPDSLHTGLLAPNLVAFYRAGDVFIAPVVPNLRPEEIRAMERGDEVAERTGATFLFDADFQPLATYSN
jgi:hypothetical protein